MSRPTTPPTPYADTPAQRKKFLFDVAATGNVELMKFVSGFWRKEDPSQILPRAEFERQNYMFNAYALPLYHYSEKMIGTLSQFCNAPGRTSSFKPERASLITLQATLIRTRREFLDHLAESLPIFKDSVHMANFYAADGTFLPSHGAQKNKKTILPYYGEVLTARLKPFDDLIREILSGRASFAKLYDAVNLAQLNIIEDKASLEKQEGFLLEQGCMQNDPVSREKIASRLPQFFGTALPKKLMPTDDSIKESFMRNPRNLISTEDFDEEGNNVAHIAAKNGHFELYQWLTTHPQMGQHLKARENYRGVIPINAQDEVGNTLLHHLCRTRASFTQIDYIQAEPGVDLKLQNELRICPLDQPNNHGTTLLIEAYNAGDLKRVTAYLKLSNHLPAHPGEVIGNKKIYHTLSVLPVAAEAPTNIPDDTLLVQKQNECLLIYWNDNKKQLSKRSLGLDEVPEITLSLPEPGNYSNSQETQLLIQKITEKYGCERDRKPHELKRHESGLSLEIYKHLSTQEVDQLWGGKIWEIERRIYQFYPALAQDKRISNALNDIKKHLVSYATDLLEKIKNGWGESKPWHVFSKEYNRFISRWANSEELLSALKKFVEDGLFDNLRDTVKRLGLASEQPGQRGLTGSSALFDGLLDLYLKLSALLKEVKYEEHRLAVAKTDAEQRAKADAPTVAAQEAQGGTVFSSVAKIADDVATLAAQHNSFATETKQGIAATEQAMKQEIAASQTATEQAMKQEIAATEQAMKQEIAASQAATEQAIKQEMMTQLNHFKNEFIGLFPNMMQQFFGAMQQQAIQATASSLAPPAAEISTTPLALDTKNGDITQHQLPKSGRGSPQLFVVPGETVSENATKSETVAQAEFSAGK